MGIYVDTSNYNDIILLLLKPFEKNKTQNFNFKT